MAKKTLVIVESAAKARTIGKFLGQNYKVKASVGHVRDLPKSKMGVDIENGFQPKYITIRGKGALIKELREESEKADRVLLATDPDREGEAIAWHLSQVINLPEDAKCRIEFNEITKEAVKKAVKAPRGIDFNRVNAQQARRILDRLVGYSLSPLLWAKVRKGLSAGRVQSVAVRLICEREKEIQEFKPEEYWTIECILRTENGMTFSAKLHNVDGKKPVIANEAAARSLEARIMQAEFSVGKIEQKERRRNALPPFTTSTLQQEAAKRLGFTPSRTMRVAQELYEGISIGAEGSVGLVTYIRTDSVRVSSEAQAEARNYIIETFKPDYYPSKPNVYKSRKTAQDAHEAIRPTSVYRRPEALKAFLSRDQLRLYRLIWSRFVASQMAAAVYDTVTVDIHGDNLVLRANSSQLKFPGHLAVYEEKEDDNEAVESTGKIPELQIGQKVGVEKVNPEQHFTQPPPRYTEASLVKLLEEKNIGRPSTYAPIIETIIKRGYVERKQKQLYPTELGTIVVDLLIQYFPEIMEVEFTAEMEENLDQIEEGERSWDQTVREFYHPFAARLERAREEMEKVNIPDEPAGKECPQCGRPMLIKMGKFGKFVACSGFPECRYTESINEVVDAKCPQCGGDIVALRTKKGRRFYGCNNYPECDFKSWNKPGEASKSKDNRIEVHPGESVS
ncbi:MAG: type I DNA topoisomerase [Syntrophomonadaceae bacterium]|nr:type I DNA topoisomerase [Syntrophomonadaceae bacterium]